MYESHHTFTHLVYMQSLGDLLDRHSISDLPSHCMGVSHVVLLANMRRIENKLEVREE